MEVVDSENVDDEGRKAKHELYENYDDDKKESYGENEAVKALV